MPPTIKELQDALRRYIDAGLEPKEVILALTAQFPDATPQDVRIATAALVGEFDSIIAEAETIRQIAETRSELRKRAERDSGRSGMTTDEALTYLAERGDEQAQELIDDRSDPQRQALQRHFDAAVELHSDRAAEGQGFAGRSEPEVDTPE
jgi:hypothetical protein